MKITVTVTDEELKMMCVNKETLSNLILEHVDNLDYNEMKILHQTEVEIEVKIAKKS